MNEPSQDPYEAPPPARHAKEPSRSTGTQKLIEALVVIAIVAILVTLLLPMIQQTRGGGHTRAYCRNRLKQIGLALYNYQDDYGSLPPAYVCDDQGVPAHSWRVLILPFMDQQDLYDRYRFDEPWNGPHNIQLQDEIPSCYRCPTYDYQVSDDSLEGQHLNRLTNYVVVLSPGGLFDDRNSADLPQVSMDSDDTLMAAEVRQHAVHWMSPVDVTPEQLLTDLRRTVNEENTNHLRVLMMLFGDGSVLSVPHDTPQEEIDAMLTIAEDGKENETWSR